MDELVLYKKMYARVVGEADGILQALAAALTEGSCGRKELMEFGERLKQALLDAEEMYISAGEEGDTEEAGYYLAAAGGLSDQPL